MLKPGDYVGETFNGLPADSSLIDAALYGMLDEMVEAELAADAPEAPKAEAVSPEPVREVCTQFG